jgi:chaperone modulatory protein CbpM
MGKNTQQMLTAVIVSDEEIVTLTEICQSCALSSERVISMIEYGIIEPIESSGPDWQFSARTIPRLLTAIRLQQDLEINLAGTALALDLLDELKTLRKVVAALQRD